MFKIGDIVTGLTVNQYAFTNSRGTFEVVGILDTMIEVKIINHEDFPEQRGNTYTVDPKKFRLMTAQERQTPVLKKIAHLNNLFENRNKKGSISEYDLAA